MSLAKKVLEATDQLSGESSERRLPGYIVSEAWGNVMRGLRQAHEGIVSLSRDSRFSKMADLFRELVKEVNKVAKNVGQPPLSGMP